MDEPTRSPVASSESTTGRSDFVYLSPPPDWLGTLVGFDAETARVWISGQSVRMRVENTHVATVLEISRSPRGLLLHKVEKDATGRPVRAPLSWTNRPEPAILSRLLRFILRVSSDDIDSLPYPPSERERELRRVIALLRSIRSHDDLSRLEPAVFDSASNRLPGDVTYWLNILAGNWGRIFQGGWDERSGDERGGDERGGSWIEVLRCAVEGDVERLRSLAANATSSDDQGPLLYPQGFVYGVLGHHDAALSCFSRALAIQPHVSSCIDVAKYLRRRGELDEAVQWLRRALLIPDIEDRLLRTACQELILCGGFDDARAVLENRCQRGPSAAVKAQTSTSDSSAIDRELILILTELYLWAGRTADARRWLKRAIELGEGGEDFRTLRARGILFALESQYEAAMEALLKADASMPGDSEVNAWLAELHLRRDEHDAARERLTRSRIRADRPYHLVLSNAVSRLKSGVGPEAMELARVLDYPIDAGPSNVKSRQETMLRFLSVFGGQRGDPSTRVTSNSRELLQAGESLGLQRVELPSGDDILFSRIASGDLLKLIGTIPNEELEARFDALAAKFASSPHPLCYKGELLLWLGRLDEAYRHFDEAQRRSKARWAFVGKAAVHVLRGEHRRALAEFRACAREFTPIPGATTHVYLGESARLRGHWGRAVEELRIAVDAKPGRIGAWVNLALAHLGRGERDVAERIVDDLERRMPRLLWDSWRALAGKPEWPVPRTHLEELLLKALEMMRGNRSSHRVTYFDGDGVFRLLPSETDWGEALAPYSQFVAMELRSRMLRGVDD